MTPIATSFLLNILSVSIGTLVSNLGILWIIGKRVQAVEKKNAEIMFNLRKEAVDRFNEEVKKKQDYIRMES